VLFAVEGTFNNSINNLSVKTRHSFVLFIMNVKSVQFIYSLALFYNFLCCKYLCYMLAVTFNDIQTNAVCSI